MNTIESNKGPYVIICAVIWEFFSYFGMRALLVLYLIQKLSFTDQHAYALYGAYISLIFVTPVIGGWLADNFLGYRMSIFLGCFLIMFGHFILSMTSSGSLYLGLSVIACGVGFFKSSAICSIGSFYGNDINGRNSAFTLYYVGGNLGATIAPILCGFVAATYGWKFGFMTAGFGMLCGLIMLIVFRKYLVNLGGATVNLKTNKSRLRFIATLTLLLIAMIAILDLVIIKLWAGYLLSVIVIISLVFLIKVYGNSDKNTRNGLIIAFILTLFGTAFWIFDQQGGCSISLFILRNINRTIYFSIGSWSFKYLIPTAMFQAINPAVVIIFGSLIAFGLKKLGKLKPGAITQVLFGTIMLTAGFFVITLGAKSAAITGQASSLWVIVGLTLIGSAEIFIDPIILSAITKTAQKKYLGLLTAIYYLFVGAIANYLAAKVALFTSVPTAAAQNPIATAMLYKNTFLEITCVGGLMIIGLIVLRKIKVPCKA